jgi:hypothetical protein
MSRTDDNPPAPGAASLHEKQAINTGRSHDKVAQDGGDMGAAPLGTDEEAGGAPAAAAGAPSPAGGAYARDPDRANAVKPRAPWAWLLLALIAAVVLGYILYGALD